MQYILCVLKGVCEHVHSHTPTHIHTRAPMYNGETILLDDLGLLTKHIYN